MKSNHSILAPGNPGARVAPRAGASLYFLICLLGLAAARLGAAGAPAPDRIPTSEGDLVLRPLNHATLAMEWHGHVLYVDPVGGAPRFAGLPRPDLILITDLHADHLSVDTLKAVATEKTRLVTSAAVQEQLPADFRQRATVLTNGQSATVAGLPIEAVAAYNLTRERERFHTRGRGNGYLLTLGGQRVYLSGDTEDIPEMRALRNVDVAFLCMNLPYTMTVEQAAAAVRAFQPRIVYPYHCRGSDLERFKQLLGRESKVEVRVRDWYGKP
jgi:L-ascorbate metabolism protein UlaG (beta-lactamase superfamily)